MRAIQGRRLIFSGQVPLHFASAHLTVQGSVTLAERRRSTSRLFLADLDARFGNSASGEKQHGVRVIRLAPMAAMT
jgi:hypothetical protein